MLQALVHACVALEHRRRGNPIGVALQVAKAQTRLAEAPHDDPLTLVARAWMEAVATLDEDVSEDAWPVP